jgi:hypothetical protein
MSHAPARDHSSHDELLLARLYGGDLEGPERERALELVARCDRCAAALAEFGAIAKATASMRTPSRPRDFSLTEADAARLRRRGWRPAALGLLGAFRSLGRVRAAGVSMAAVGVAGLLVVSTLSGGQPGGSRFAQNRAAAPAGAAHSSTTAMDQSAEQGYLAAGSPAGGANGATSAPTAGPAQGPMESLPGSKAVPTAAPAAPSPAVPSPAASTGALDMGPIGAGEGTAVTAGGGGQNPESQPGPGSAGPDPWLAGFAALAVAGIAVMVAPALWRRRSARRHGR